MQYDIVGDVHGHAEPLEALMTELGYRERGGAWRHPDRHLVFLGDLIDRGPEQLRVVDIARRMIDAGTGSAVMGNHELNALAWATRHPETGEPYRAHTPGNRHQHEAFLGAVDEGSPLHRELLDFFRSMPLWSEFPAFRAVHACWHPGMMKALAHTLGAGGNLTEEGAHSVLRRGTPEFKAGEVVLKGLEIALPKGVSYRDAQGTERFVTRLKWWDAMARSYRSGAQVDEELAASIPDEPLPPESIVDYDGQKPVFFGHYWLSGEPFLVADRLACLDFSVAKDGYLCAYRHDGEEILDPAKLSWIGPNASLTPR